MADDSEKAFDDERQNARELLDDESITAFYLGVIRDGETADTTFAQTADDPEQEGLQALSLLATHVRIVSNEAGVDPATVAGDAATLAGRMEELSPEGLADVEDDRHADL
ncbi:MAG: hypothetical protein ACQET5_08660 [Halobacteriota archaeon]|uniref:hypothetical protein n=1 Tax=Natronomonas sp. TaxID=2184060 RepID=UPI0039771816